MTHVTHVFIKYSHARRKNNNYFIKKVFIKKRCHMCHVSRQSPVYHIRLHLFFEHNKRIVGVQTSRKHHVYLTQVPYLAHVSAIDSSCKCHNYKSVF